LITKFSVSSLDTHKKCPKKYHYRYIEKPDVKKEKWNFTELGSCAHRILELFHERLLETHVKRSDFPKLMKQCFVEGVKEFDIRLLQQETWMPSGEMPGTMALKIMIQDYLDKLRGMDELPNVIGNEMPYSFKLDDRTIVRGFIDRVDQISEDTYAVVDYKTSKNPKYLSDFQLLVYAEAIRRKFKNVKKVYGSYIMLKHKSESKDFEFNEHSMDQCNKKLHKKAELIYSDNTWVKKPSILCKWCDYRSICQDAWAE